jgi:hypothetical protein
VRNNRSTWKDRDTIRSSTDFDDVEKKWKMASKEYTEVVRVGSTRIEKSIERKRRSVDMFRNVAMKQWNL